MGEGWIGSCGSKLDTGSWRTYLCHTEGLEFDSEGNGETLKQGHFSHRRKTDLGEERWKETS